MPKKILVPLDGSALAEEILPLVCDMRQANGGEIILFHCVDPETLDQTDPNERAFLEEIRWHAKPRAEEYMRRVARSIGAHHQQTAAQRHPALAAQPDSQPPPLPGSPPGIQTHVTIGGTAVEILRFAEREGVDLIAMSTHGRSGLGRWVFGSVADRVVQGSTVPILMRRPHQPDSPTTPPTPRNIVVPLDGSPLAETALPYAKEIAAAIGAGIHLLRVIQSQVVTAFGLYAEDPTGAIDLMAHSYLEDQQPNIAQCGRDVSVSVLRGTAASSIIDFAQRIQDGIVVMSTHGRSGLGRWVMGSVADKVVRGSSVPVLLIPQSATHDHA